ncbi:hypothetical protein DCO47_17665 [Pseudomonas sp. NDM]|nr:hypothetical protein DCO47_17665 [Pseudomonas sp. NDM]
MLPLGCEAAPMQATQHSRDTVSANPAPAAQSSGSKLPRHTFSWGLLTVNLATTPGGRYSVGVFP